MSGSAVTNSVPDVIIGAIQGSPTTSRRTSSGEDGEDEDLGGSKVPNVRSSASMSTAYVFIPPVRQREAVGRPFHETYVAKVAQKSASAMEEDERSTVDEMFPDGNKPKVSPAKKHVAMCLFGCFTTMGCRTRIVRRMAYHPPVPGYTVEKEDDFRWTPQPLGPLPVVGTPISQIHGLQDPHGPLSCDFTWLKTSRGNKIGCLVFRFKPIDVKMSPTIIFSHGNATDLGGMFAHFFNICLHLKVTVVGYDYSGYGRSTGSPSERNTFADIRAAYKYTRDVLKVPSELIIVYGQSLGSGPSCEIASDPKSTPVGGLVLHSGISSGMRLLFDDIQQSPWFDIYKNVEKLPHTKCPVFVIHGQQDQQVALSHGMALAAAARKEPPTSCCASACSSRKKKDPVDEEKKIVMEWWVTNADHNDIEEKSQEQYYRRIDEFVDVVRQRSKTLNPHR